MVAKPIKNGLSDDLEGNAVKELKPPLAANLLFPPTSPKVLGDFNLILQMARISFDTPFYYFTCVAHHRLAVFRTDKFKDLLCEALNEARRSSGMLFFAYAIMWEHLHIITDGQRKPSDSLRFLNGVSARKIIDHLKKDGPDESLRKLRLAEKADGYKYSLWEHHSDKFLLTSESMLMQKVKYIHDNPVKEGLVERAEDYKYSSARYWLKKPLLDDEPIEVDIKNIQWRSR